jgi:hypothetical protein
MKLFVCCVSTGQYDSAVTLSEREEIWFMWFENLTNKFDFKFSDFLQSRKKEKIWNRKYGKFSEIMANFREKSKFWFLTNNFGFLRQIFGKKQSL